MFGKDLPAFPFRLPDVPLPFYNTNTDTTKSFTRYGWPENAPEPDTAVHEQCLDDYMENHWRIDGIKTYVKLLDISLFRVPAHSRRIFKHLLSHSLHTEDAVAEVVTFLEDLTLNTRGAGNYAIAVEHLVAQKASRAAWDAILGSVNRALSVGLVSSSQLCAILRSLSSMKIKRTADGERDPTVLVGYYRDIWEAIGRCDVFHHKHLRSSVVNTFLEALLKIGPHAGSLSLAKQIILASHGRRSQRRQWVPKFIIQWLELSAEPVPQVSGDYVNELLSPFIRRTVAEYLICVTELLASSSGDRKILIERWRECLYRTQNISNLALSSAWYDLRSSSDTEQSPALDGYSSVFSKSQQIILRLWILRTLRMAAAEGQYSKWQTPDLAISYLLDFYYYMTRESDTDHFLTLLMKGIHQLGLPPSGLLIAAVDLKTDKCMTKPTRKYLQRLETSEISFIDMFRDLDAYNSTTHYFLPNYEALLRQIDITSPSFIEQIIHLASQGDSKSVWTIVRILRSHTPLKIAISMAWLPNPDPSEMALMRWYPELQSQKCPDPHVVLEVINSLAIALSCSKHLSPRRSFQLVHWLYRFLRQHRGPVKPPLVRAMYHAGVVRYRQSGKNVPRGQYEYIIGIVQRFEDPDVVRAVMEPPRFG